MAGPKSSPCTERSQADSTHRLVNKLAAFFAARLKPGSRVCVGLSGGLDSVVLLHALNRLVSSTDIPFALTAVHVHHGISPNADAWAEFCVEYCQRQAVPLSVVHVAVPRCGGDGLEAAARRVRHDVFAKCDADWLALAHHHDDQAETVLLNLLRGAGIAGAAGMRAERAQPYGPRLVRPLLDVPRSVIKDYAAEYSLPWIDDESNGDLRYRRNFLRHAVLPPLKVKFPGAQQALARAADHFAEAAALLDELAALDRAALATSTGRIGLPGFNALSPARARNLLRFEWRAAGHRAPDSRWMDEALRQLATSGAQAETCLSTADGELRLYRNELYFCGPSPTVPDRPLLWAGEHELPWAGGRVQFVPVIGRGIRASSLADGAVFLRSRQGGERLQPTAGRPRRSLRNLCQEYAVPPWERVRLPYLWCGERLVWVGALGVDSAFACPPGQAGFDPVWESC
ncbi:tRNA lysidine(34) synthetase TilS [Propionivibrio sp.]|uniref:tRNA lysidine(34) synthetase TilS n=1 Tax=Propionivibrio sp. TaxID=2212460 RepID=UPI0025F7F4DA|nr:tRNA lysidine(34) synthetase TilS [Propionivibrio sp.]MBK7356127.1 tRNA lysidine(34) synthetase TilS [Propionivibrio sp.]